MADYYSDDLDSGQSDEGFSEDLLPNEDYDLLYEALPKLQAQLAPYNDQIDLAVLKECLYNNYFEVEESVAELKSRYKRRGMYTVLQGVVVFV